MLCMLSNSPIFPERRKCFKKVGDLGSRLPEGLPLKCSPTRSIACSWRKQVILGSSHGYKIKLIIHKGKLDSYKANKEGVSIGKAPRSPKEPLISGWLFFRYMAIGGKTHPVFTLIHLFICSHELRHRHGMTLYVISCIY